MVETFLTAVAAWAAARPDIVAVALVGSQARGAAGPGSDIDFVILTPQARAYIADTGWLVELAGLVGDKSVAATGLMVERMQAEDYGAVTSLRVFFRGGRKWSSASPR